MQFNHSRYYTKHSIFVTLIDKVHYAEVIYNTQARTFVAYRVDNWNTGLRTRITGGSLQKGHIVWQHPSSDWVKINKLVVQSLFDDYGTAYLPSKPAKA